MLITLIAAGVIATSGSVVAPGTGVVDYPAGQMAASVPIAAVPGTSSGIPPTAFAWPKPFDPSNRRPYGMDWTAELGDQKIASIEALTMSALGASLGVQIEDGSDNIKRAPIIDVDGKKIGIWFKVADAFKTNAAFNYPGTKIGVAALIKTDSDPFELIELTWVLTLVQG
jgi:hypothetical protein